jgi:hypothetical protein
MLSRKCAIGGTRLGFVGLECAYIVPEVKGKLLRKACFCIVECENSCSFVIILLFQFLGNLFGNIFDQKLLLDLLVLLER